jgi:hypothetical protein
MFVKYQMKGGIANDAWATMNLLLADFQKILDGTVTATSGFNSNVADIAACEFSGSINSNIYHTVAKHDSTTTTDEGYVQFKKRHHHYLTDNNYDWERTNYIILSPGADDVPSFNSFNKAGTNGRPATNITGSTWIGSENIDFSMADAPCFYFFISDYNFMWCMYNESRDEGTIGGVLDYEMTDADKHVFDNVTTNYCPMYIWAFDQAETYQLIGTLPSVDYSNFWVGRTDYLSNVGAVDSHETWSAATENALYTRGQYDGNKYPSLYPAPYKRVMSAPLPAGDTAHQLHPVFVSPHSNSDTGSDPIMAKFPYIWRTTDDIGYTGQTITFNGVDYVVLVAHKTGGLSDADTTDNWANSCYLFRKTIGGN